mmetsp:Transcript_78750/g.132136  ORF Transcript_78750/g.132136 Transcript_78750/m.132136 type:complete len:359 (+) Transcript_78750:1237-2313(+)
MAWPHCCTWGLPACSMAALHSQGWQVTYKALGAPQSMGTMAECLGRSACPSTQPHHILAWPSVFGLQSKALRGCLLHLAREVLLVGDDILCPRRDRLLITNPDLLGHLVDETEIVGHQQQTTFKIVDGLSQGVNAAHIQMICRLVQQQNVRMLDSDHGHHNAGLDPMGQRCNMLRLRTTTDTKAAQSRPPLLQTQLLLAAGTDYPLLEMIHHELQGRHVRGQHFGRMLIVAPNTEMGVQTNLSLDRLNIFADQLQQGTLTCSIGPHQGNATVQVDPKVQFGVQVLLLLPAVREGHVVECDHRRRQCSWAGEVELVFGVGNRLLCQPRLHHLINNFLLALGLLEQIGIGPAGGNELLDV